MKNRRGFTTIEILVAIVIIAILAGILMVGLRSIGAGVKERATQVTLQNLVSMLEEYRLTGKGDDLDAIIYKGNSNSAGPAGVFVERYGWLGEGMAGRDYYTVIFTARVMQKLYSVPSNRSALEQLPPSQLYTPAYLASVKNESMPRGYWVGDTVAYQGAIHRATQNEPSGDAGGSGWAVARSGSPILLDAFGNPIVYVRPEGLQVENVASPRIVTAPDGTGFFVSAGPDGKLGGGTTEDPMLYARDNIYSFEQ